MADDKIFDIMVKQLSSQMTRWDHFLTELPKTVRVVLGENQWKKPMWKERTDKDTGEVYAFSKFEDFVSAPPTAGIGTTMDLLERVCRSDKVAWDMLDQVAQVPLGTNQHSEGFLNQETPKGNAVRPTGSTELLRRLRKDRPDLHTLVLTNEMAITEAAVAAGFYPPRIAINLKSPKSAAATIRNNAPPEFVAELRRLLDE